MLQNIYISPLNQNVETPNVTLLHNYNQQRNNPIPITQKIVRLLAILQKEEKQNFLFSLIVEQQPSSQQDPEIKLLKTSHKQLFLASTPQW